MLLEFSCINHRSIKNKIVFSLLPGNDDSHKENLIEADDRSVLRSAVIYGANGSGKSSFITAVDFMRMLVLNSITHQPGTGIRQDAHKLSSLEDPTCYSMQFIADGVRFAYGFSLEKTLVSEEYLYYFPNGRQAMIFERDAENFKTGSKFKKTAFSTCTDVLKPNRLLLSCAANFCSIQEIDTAYKFFVDGLVTYNDPENWLRYSLYKMKENSSIKSSVVSFLQELGVGVRDIRISIEKGSFDPAALPPFLSDDFKNALMRQNIDAIQAFMVYDSFQTDLFNEESTGIRKLVGMLCPLLDIMESGKVLIFDEIETSLHESLIYELVKLFSSHSINRSAQLIFTTHDTSLLSLDLFRRDQIWFTEMKGEDRSTDMYSLAEIKNVRKAENYGRGYITGKYGAIPMLNLDFASLVGRL